MRLKDGAASYGWISIGLHWVAAALVVWMLFLGSSIKSLDGDSMLRLHTSIGVTAYLLLWLRIVWRFAVGHPGPGPKQQRVSFRLGRVIHLLILVGVGVLLASGPPMAWTGGVRIEVFGLFHVPSLLPVNAEAHAHLRRIHGGAASAVAIGALLHIAGVVKHVAFDRDGTFDRIMSPGRRRDGAR